MRLFWLLHGMNEEQLWTKLKSMPVHSPPGERFSYNQTNYYVFGKVIEKVTGKPFAQVSILNELHTIELIQGAKRSQFFAD